MQMKKYRTIADIHKAQAKRGEFIDSRNNKNIQVIHGGRGSAKIFLPFDKKSVKS
jgi:hypothetical protein